MVRGGEYTPLRAYIARRGDARMMRRAWAFAGYDMLLRQYHYRDDDRLLVVSDDGRFVRCVVVA